MGFSGGKWVHSSLVAARENLDNKVSIVTLLADLLNILTFSSSSQLSGEVF